MFSGLAALPLAAGMGMFESRDVVLRGGGEDRNGFLLVEAMAVRFQRPRVPDAHKQG